MSDAQPNGQRSYLLTLVLAVQFGVFGFDRFYLGKIGTGILKGITFGGLGVWAILDVQKLCMNQTTDVDGRPLHGAEYRDPAILLWLSAPFGLFNRMYLRQGWQAWVKAFTLGGFGLWNLWDLFMVVTGKMEDAQGTPLQGEPRRYQGVALLISIFGGVLGLDRLYLGHKSMAMLKFFTFGGGFIWWIIDIIDLIKGNIKDVNGNELLQD